MEILSESIKKVIQDLSGRHSDPRAQIYSNWGKIVGKLLAQHSAPVDLRNKTLVVNVESSAWMYMLKLRQAQILGKIKKLVDDKDIQDIKLRIGSSS